MGEMMKEQFWKKLVLVTVMAAVLLLSAAGCSLLGKIEILGTWHDAYGGKWVVTETSLSMYWTTTDTVPAYEFDIVGFNNGILNGGESGEGDCGYAVIKSTTPPSWNLDQEGTYTVFRWQNLMNTNGVLTMEYAEGSPPAWPDGFGEGLAETVEMATEANGWYGLGYVSSTLQ